MDANLTPLCGMAAEYVQIEEMPSKTRNRERRSEILAHVASLNPVEAMYFCQQVVSNCRNLDSANMALIVLTNRIVDRKGAVLA